MKSFVIVAAIGATLSLAACGDAPDNPEPAATIEIAPPAPVAPAEQPPAVSVEVPQGTTIPGTDVTVEQAIDHVQRQVEDIQMTDAEKRNAVAEARKKAEDAARAAGFNEERIRQAGDAAEATAKTVFGVQ